MKISQFYNEDFVDYASYSTLRMLGSAIDGQKNVHRKILRTILDKNIKTDTKVSQLNSTVAQYCEYLHGDCSSAISGMAQEFSGTNNVPLLAREGSFGTRFTNLPSAPRYIYTYGSDELFKLFKKEDSPILEKQYFEGNEIEPKFYLPILPMLIINGSEGLATGFSQKILSRNPKNIKKYITNYLNGKPNNQDLLKPYFEGFNGIVQYGENNKQWLIKGTIQRVNSTTILITEIPVGIELKTYIKKLDKLQDQGRIKSYKDLSNKSFRFEVKYNRGVLDKSSEDTLLNQLGLVKKITENYTAIDEDLRVKTFNNVQEIIEYYITIKMKYLQKRKDYNIQNIKAKIEIDYSKYYFIKAITDEKLKINKRSKSDIEADLDLYNNILKKDDSYNYLLGMPIYSLTEEKMKELQFNIKTLKEKLNQTVSQTLNEIWKEDLL